MTVLGAFDHGTVIDMLPSQSVDLTRHAAPTNVDGTWQAGATSAVAITAVVVPMTAKEIRAYDPGLRAGEALHVFSRSEVKGASVPDGTPGDQFARAGGTYEIRDVEDWSGQAGIYHGRAVKVTR